MNPIANWDGPCEQSVAVNLEQTSYRGYRLGRHRNDVVCLVASMQAQVSCQSRLVDRTDPSARIGSTRQRIARFIAMKPSTASYARAAIVQQCSSSCDCRG